MKMEYENSRIGKTHKDIFDDKELLKLMDKKKITAEEEEKRRKTKDEIMRRESAIEDRLKNKKVLNATRFFATKLWKKVGKIQDKKPNNKHGEKSEVSDIRLKLNNESS